MSDAYVIEVHGETVGLIVRYPRHDRAYRFLASVRAVNALEGQAFKGPRQAEQAARKLMGDRRRGAEAAFL